MSATVLSSDLADAYGLLQQQDRTLIGLRAVLEALKAVPPAPGGEGLLTAAGELAVSALELCSFAMGEIELLERLRREGAA
ncbi:hypothetical protein EV699_103133 [Plasticicumulans lactativorans]|uniref:Uncharacterized protein n=1 Tax=Plasticicumulans lactativorans TaxID=1133106 RepID=A0A4R2LC28_9GAMM|nr:hypothetical protein [Plasticicumulans lactativorans]TCO83084.1 hypothetical protein EV699_103133 [Plasticicumulans lactativorans]